MKKILGPKRKTCESIHDLEERCDKQANGCWIWRGGRTTTGYGSVRSGNKGWKAHRLAFHFAFPDVSIDGKQVCHRCDTPLCLNPQHLFVGTAKDNIGDANAKGRIARGERHYKTTLSAEAVIAIRKMRAAGFLQRQIADAFLVSRSTVGRILNGESWAWLKS